jgi:2-keto-4-pentenoate hydratase/2-oxohepta-3-ene-1,7-dioic acid hydratase in catechol pathway
MRLCRFSPDGTPRLGAFAGDSTVVDVAASARALGRELPDVSDLPGLIEAGPDAWRAVAEVVDAAGGSLDSAWAWNADQVTLHHPYRPRKNVVRAGGNMPRPDDGSAAVTLPPGRWLRGFPIAYYTKAPTAVLDPGQPISWPARVATQVYAEPQLAVIVGGTLSFADPADVPERIFGYAVATDVSALDLKIKHGQWPKAVSLDSFFPWGPAVVTRDEIPDPDALAISLTLNGDRRIEGSTSATILSVAEMLAQLSTGITLEAGDVLLLGTPDVVGFGASPARWLEEGDTLTSTIEGVGSITNPVQPFA